mmetsp:Transcript_72666/g.135781  ORF Transcript_72666/g.135781 Transcript_72666/m.135781 type:complete len:116 (+) Transcript_72666:102-449(+)
MGGKAKPTKHTSSELKQKEKDALCNKGGGAAGKADRAGGSVGHSKFKCNICGQAAPDPKSMQMHYESKHPKETFDISTCTTDVHAQAGGVTTQGVAVRGGIKKHFNAPQHKDKDG